MPCVLYLADILQLIVDRLDQGSLSQHYPVKRPKQSVLHVLLDLGD